LDAKALGFVISILAAFISAFDLQNLGIDFFEAALGMCVLSVGIGQPRTGLLRLSIIKAIKNEAKLVIPRLGSFRSRHLLVPLRMGVQFLAHVCSQFSYQPHVPPIATEP